MNLVLVKIGTKALFEPGWMQKTVAQLVALRNLGYRVIITSSGSAYTGKQILGADRAALYSSQVLSGFGCTALFQRWNELLQKEGLHAIPLLLTHSNITTSGEAASIKRCLLEVLQHDDGVIIANENDLVSDEEIQYWGSGLGENDKLQVALLTLAQSIPEITVSGVLFATHQGGYFSADPAIHSDAYLIPQVSWETWPHRTYLEIFLAPYINNPSPRLPNDIYAKICAGLVCAKYRNVPQVGIATPHHLVHLITQDSAFRGTRIVS
jgi:glutamate 5-kinase